MTNPELAAKVRAAYDRVKDQPEVRRNEDGTFTVKGDAFLAFLDLRHLMPEVLTALGEKK